MKSLNLQRAEYYAQKLSNDEKVSLGITLANITEFPVSGNRAAIVAILLGIPVDPPVEN